MAVEDKLRKELDRWTRLDARRRQPVKGRGPNVDDDAPPEQRDVRRTLLDEAQHLAQIEGDFWKRSEYLKCKLGIKMPSDERGLPSGYKAGPGAYRSRITRTR